MWLRPPLNVVWTIGSWMHLGCVHTWMCVVVCFLVIKSLRMLMRRLNRLSIVGILEIQPYILEDNLLTWFFSIKLKFLGRSGQIAVGMKKGKQQFKKTQNKKKKTGLVFWKLPKLLILYSWLSWKLAQREIWAYLGDGKQETDLRTVSSSCDSIETDAKSK